MITFWGKVRRHIQRGKRLGFPTANVNLAKKLSEGVYLSKTKSAGKIYNSLTFIGKVKTYNEKKFHSETYFLDFNKDIYHQWISIRLIKKIRGNKRFKNESDLINQMKRDEIKAREYFKSN